MQPVPNQIFQASWPKGHAPILPPYTSKVAAVALVIFTSYYSKALAIGAGIALTAFWTVRKVATYIIHPIAFDSFLYSIGTSYLGNLLAYKIQDLGTRISPEFPKLYDLVEEEKNKITSNREQLRKDNDCAQVKMKTPDGFKLDGILYQKKDTNPMASKAIIWCGGNGECYEYTAPDIFSNIYGGLYRYDFPVSILCFNPRGVFESEGSSSPDMLPYDGYTAFEYLVSLGYQPENIVFCGLSLGGATATIAASLAELQHPEAQIGVLNINSFANLPLAAQHLLGNGIVGKTASLLIRAFAWHMDAATRWITLRHPEKTIVCHLQDGVILHDASIYQAVPNPDRYLVYGEENGEKGPEHHNDIPYAVYQQLPRILRLN